LSRMGKSAAHGSRTTRRAHCFQSSRLHRAWFRGINPVRVQRQVPHSYCIQGLGPLLPQAEAAEEGMAIAAEPRAGGNAFQLLAVAAAENDIVGFQRGLQFHYDLRHMLAPFLLA